MTDKKLRRSRNQKMLAGVCGGIAKYFELDATLVRAAFVLLSAITGAGIIAYLVLIMVIPQEKFNETL